MSDEFLPLARQFAVLVRERNREAKTVSEVEQEIIRGILLAAGFEPSCVQGCDVATAQVRSRGRYRCINPDSRIRVVAQDGTTSQTATGWLNDMFKMTSNQQAIDQLRDKDEQREPGETLVREIAQQIARSVPLRPIKLLCVPEGGALLEPPPRVDPWTVFQYFVRHTTDENTLPSASEVVAAHEMCGGEVSVVRTVSSTFGAALCRRCGLRVTFPSSAVTYGDLRRALEGSE